MNDMMFLGLGYIGAGLGAGITLVGAGLGIGKLAASALEGTARQPEAGPALRTTMIIAAALALTTFALVNFAGIREQGLFSYLAHIVPKGVPFWLYPLLFPIELIGLLTKTFALCIRLFANMIAGHIVILAFVSFIFIFGALNTALGLGVAPVSVALVLFILLLELFVAFLQAYVFTFLTSIFTGAAMHPH